MISFLAAALPACTRPFIAHQAAQTLQSCFRTFAARKQLQLTTAKRELESGIEISPEILSTVQTLLPLISNREDHPQFHRYTNCSSIVFTLTGVPGLIFKTVFPGNGAYYTGRDGNGSELIQASEMISRRFANMIQARVACRAHQLSRLILPHAKMFTITSGERNYTLIAEQLLDLIPKTGIQEELYFNASEEFNEAVRQLVLFMKEVGFSDAEWRNIPILRSPDGKAREIGLD